MKEVFWKENAAPSQLKKQPKLVSMPAKPVASVLSIWSARQCNKASSSHMEFAGRMNYGNKAELYPALNSNTRYGVWVMRHQAWSLGYETPGM